MAKIIKFALELKDGESARTIEDLRAHFDLEKVVAYFMNGRLLMWLRHRHLDTEADAVERLSTEDAELAKKLCEILGVAYENHQSTADAINATALMADHERLSRLRQITSDPELLAKIDRVAFDEKDLRRLAFDNEPEVYLCNGRFMIPLNVQNKHYIGIGKAEAVIVSEEWIDFEGKGIKFTEVNFDEKYQQKKAETTEKWIVRGEEAYKTNNYDEALKWFKKTAMVGNEVAMHNMGAMYCFGEGVPKDYSKAIGWYEKAAGSGFAKSMGSLGIMYRLGKGASQDCGKAMEWYKKAVEYGEIDAMNEIGCMFLYGVISVGFRLAQDYEEAVKWFLKACDAGNGDAMYHIGMMYFSGKGVSRNTQKAMEWFEKAANFGSGNAMFQIGMSCYRNDKNNGSAKAIEWLKKAADFNNIKAMYFIGLSYSIGAWGLPQDDEKAIEWLTKAANADTFKALAASATLARIYKKIGDNALAETYSAKYTEIYEGHEFEAKWRFWDREKRMMGVSM